ncbi:MAG: SDR family oxidoreductase [Candidatus Peribacteraceae bacterium]|nr:SDR family oxidoreductase [Candidatus Peribacteraceae bacterium]
MTYKNPFMALGGKRIVVTGAANGIGLETTKLLLEMGSTVIAIDRSFDGSPLVNLTSERLIRHKMDLRDETNIKSFWLDQEKQIHGLVNSAGISLVGWFEDISFDDYMNVLKTNLVSTFLMSQQFYKSRIDSHPFSLGYIVNMGSLGSDQAFRGGAAYVSSKGGIKALTRQMARELRRKMVVICIQPEALIGPSKMSDYVIDRLVETRNEDDADDHGCQPIPDRNVAELYFAGIDAPQTCMQIAQLTAFCLTSWAIPLSGSSLQCLDGRS